jgi:quercetin dioxygenase-like cupin family protein
MNVFKGDQATFEPAEAPIFTGSVSRRSMVGPKQSTTVTAAVVSFAAGGRTKFHTHTFDQLLYIVDGEGIVATESQENRVSTGDLVHIPAGEKHWHGGTPTTSMAHLTVGGAGSTEVLE